jgi:hypothetical protein
MDPPVGIPPTREEVDCPVHQIEAEVLSFRTRVSLTNVRYHSQPLCYRRSAEGSYVVKYIYWVDISDLNNSPVKSTIF